MLAHLLMMEIFPAFSHRTRAFPHIAPAEAKEDSPQIRELIQLELQVQIQTSKEGQFAQRLGPRDITRS